MKKRMLGLLLALALCLTLLPAAALAADTGLDFTEAAADESGKGYSWNNETKTLVIDGLNLTVGSGNAITLPGGSNIVVNGSNIVAAQAGSVIVSNGSLVISGEGSLTGRSNGKNDAYHGIMTNGGDLTISSCTLDLAIVPDFISAIITTAEFDENGKGLDKGGDLTFKDGANVVLSDVDHRAWGFCTGYSGFKNKTCGDVLIEKGSTVTVSSLMACYVGLGSNVTVSGLLDASGCDESNPVSANILTYDSIRIDGVVKMPAGTYMDTRSKAIDVQAGGESTGALFGSEFPAAWIFSDKRGFNGSWAAYCNRRDSGLKKLYIAKDAVFTVVPTGKVVEKDRYQQDVIVDQLLRLKPEKLSDISGGGYIRVEEGASAELRLDGVTKDDVQKLDIFCGKVKLNDDEEAAEFHAGGKATCTEGAVCAVCGKEYSEAAGHDYGDLIAGRPATYTEDGMKAHYVCSVCGGFFDAQKNPVTEKDLIIARLTADDGSSSDSDPTYPVSAPSKTPNGTVTVRPSGASRGDTVTITVRPDSGYTVETVTVTDSRGNQLELTDVGGGKYTFVMPGRGVSVNATFMEDNSVLNFFYDVPNDAYFYDAVKWAVENGITNGRAESLFAPGDVCTRAEIVTFLWRAAGSPVVNYAMDLEDVRDDEYYAEAVRWALSLGITKGTSDTAFSPNATCTRAQIVTFLYRAMGESSEGRIPFTDVPAGSYYEEAVSWATASGVTNGMAAGIFAPDEDCTRAQIVTFLFRAYNNK